MTPFERHLQTASGFLELRLPLDANEEIEQIEPEMQTLSDVQAVRVGIYRALERWDLMEVVARQLCRLRPDEPGWPLALAFSLCRVHGPQEALAVLAQVANRFPESGAILYDLARYAAQFGHLGVARARLAEATALELAIRVTALGEPDFAPLHDPAAQG